MTDEDQNPSDISKDFIRTYKFFYGFLLVGLILVLIGQWGGHPLAALLWSFACLACGGFIGFLFGIPRVLQQDAPATAAPVASPTTAAATNAGAPEKEAVYSIRVNTNLEQISDWLTKIIVGVTLIEFQKIPDNINRAATFIAYSLGGAVDKAFAGGLLIFFSIGGFLGSYLFTRLFLTGALYRAERRLGLSEITPSEKASIASSRLSLQEPTAQQLTGAAEQAANRIVDKPLDALTTASDIAVWAKAQLNAGRVNDAIKGYDKAIALSPNDVKLRLEKAVALRNANMTQNQVKEQLLDAYRRLAPQTDRDVKADLYNSLTYTFLYLAPPEGFEGAIKYGEEYVNDSSNLRDGAIYISLAAAYGQKFRWYESHRDETVRLDELRDKALGAIKTALALEPNWREKIRMLLDSQYPGKDPLENDLEVFAQIEDFWDALGLPMPAA